MFRTLQSPATDAGYGVRYGVGGQVIHELEESFKPTVEENVRIIVKRTMLLAACITVNFDDTKKGLISRFLYTDS